MGKTKTERVERAIYMKSGSYYVVKRNQWSHPFPSLQDAQMERERIEKEQAPKPEGGPFADFVRKVYYPHYLSKMKTNTQHVYKHIFEKCIIPFFASKKVADITQLDVMEFQQHMTESGLRAPTVNGRMIILKMVLKRAKELGFITESPAEKVTRVREIKQERIILTEKEIIELINKIEDHPYRYAIALAGLAGARVSECLGFRWEDFDLGKKGRITFARQINNAFQIDDLKSTASAANLPMVNALTELLREWKEICPDPEWLFQGAVADQIDKIRGIWGKPGKYSYKYHRKQHSCRKNEYHKGTSLSNWWVRARRYYGLDGMRFHDFRHSFATNMVTRCTNIKLAQKLARHANIETTLEIYTHVHPEQLEEVWTWDF